MSNNESKTYKGRPVKESHQTESNGWDPEDTYHETTDRYGRIKYVSEYELDNNEAVSLRKKSNKNVINSQYTSMSDDELLDEWTDHYIRANYSDRITFDEWKQRYIK